MSFSPERQNMVANTLTSDYKDGEFSLTCDECPDGVSNIKIRGLPMEKYRVTRRGKSAVIEHWLRDSKKWQVVKVLHTDNYRQLDVIMDLGEVPEEPRTIEDLKKKFLYKYCAAACDMKLYTSQEEMVCEDLEEKNAEDIKKRIQILEILGRKRRKGDDRVKDNEPLSQVDHRLIEMKDKLCVLKGHMQSGKTSWMITRAIISVMNGWSALLVLREMTVDQIQLCERVARVNHDFREMALKWGFPPVDLIEVVGDVHKLTKDKEKTKSIFSGETPKLVVCISNKGPLKKLAEIVETIELTKYEMFIDEADHVDSGVSEKTHHLMTLKRSAMMIVDVSATVLESLFKKDVKASRVFFLEPPPGYRGIRHFNKPLLGETVFKFSDRTDVDFFVTDPGLKEHMRQLACTIPFNDGEKSYCTIHLFNLGSARKPQERAQETLRRLQPSICSIVYNGTGISVYHPLYTNKKILNLTNKGGYHTGKVSISKIIGFFEEQGIEETRSMAIFSGKLAGRGISYVSEKMRTGNGWHLRGLRLAASPKMNQANLLQAVGRLCGIFNEGMELTLFVDERTRADVLKAYVLQEEALARAKIDAAESDGLMKNIMRDMVLYHEKVSNRQLSTTTKSSEFHNQVMEEDDGGWKNTDRIMKQVKANKDAMPIVKRAEKVKESEERRAVRKVKREQVMREMKEEEKVESHPNHDEFIRLTTKMFPKWGKGSSNISHFFSQLDPYKYYTRSELNEICTGRVTDYFVIPGQKRIKNGDILQIVNGKYRLHPSLVKKFLEYF